MLVPLARAPRKLIADSPLSAGEGLGVRAIAHLPTVKANLAQFSCKRRMFKTYSRTVR